MTIASIIEERKSGHVSLLLMMSMQVGSKVSRSVEESQGNSVIQLAFVMAIAVPVAIVVAAQSKSKASRW